MKSVQTLHVNKSANGLPIFWERKDEKAAMKIATLIGTGDFERKKVIFINRSEKLDKRYNAIFIPKVGDTIIKAIQIGNMSPKILFSLYVIIDIDKETINEKEKFRITYESLFEMVTIDELIENYPTISDMAHAALNKLISSEVTSHFCSQEDIENINQNILEKQ